ncbi:MAG: hypothetical protein ACR2GP_13585 [Burkholderiaceae bacterium]
MADPSLDNDNDTRERLDRGSSPGMPRWVKVFGFVVIALALLFVVSFLAGVELGPGLHAPSGNAGAHAEHGVRKP